MAKQRVIDGNELLEIESLLNTDIIQKSKEASWLMSQVLHDIAAMPTIAPESLLPRWIPVSDRLPETGEVLATNGAVIAVAPASSVRRKDTYITHWMPLPELPGGGDADDL